MDNATYVLMSLVIVAVGVLQPLAMAYLMSDKADTVSKAGRYSSLCTA